jgi:hypothetical protein
MWATATVLLGVFVDWRITVPLNQQGLIMVKDEADLWQRILFSALLAGIYSALNIGLFALFERYSNRRKKIQ